MRLYSVVGKRESSTGTLIQAFHTVSDVWLAIDKRRDSSTTKRFNNELSYRTWKRMRRPMTISKCLFIVIGSLYLGNFLVAIDTIIIGIAILAITTDFHALDSTVWYGSGYLLTLTALQPTCG